jgi:hypothetical protein
MEVSGQLHTRPLYPQGKSPWYPLDRRLGGPQSWSRRGGEKKNSQTLPALEPPIIQLVALRYTAELTRLLTSKHTDEKRSQPIWLLQYCQEDFILHENICGCIQTHFLKS